MAKANTYDIGATRAPRHLYVDSDIVGGRDIEFAGDIITISNTSNISTNNTAAAYIRFLSYDAAFQIAMELVGGRVDILRAGDITMLDDKFIDLGNDTAGAAANAANRGKLRFVEGAGGARDRVYSCMKSDADAYSWVEIANGGA